MKILLLDDYSGLFKNLRAGLLQNGHQVTFIGTGDRWKKIEGMDVKINSKPGIYGKLVRRLQIIWNLRKMKGYDAVILINQSFLFRGISSLMIKYICKNNSSVFLSSCGGDVPYAQFGVMGGFKKRWPHNGSPKNDTIYKYLLPFQKRLHLKLCKNLDGVIPIAYEYAVSWRNSDHASLLLPTIPPPITVNEIEPKFFDPNKKKIIFFHGLNREDHKGTSYIKEAMQNMAQKYPDEIDIIIDGKMSLDKYLNLLAEVDVVIDQCKAYTYSSMNTLYAMSLGKLVMVHCEDEGLAEFGIKEAPPVFKISPEVKVIESQIERVISKKNELRKLSIESRNYVKKYHAAELIAQKYIENIRIKIDNNR